ncbi:MULTISPECIES: SDR family oxidoreductase [unclassified Agarivorans]|uniref:SDR family oxidoreductase n=1 Tax=unclassified Agarivorans TaxID=2636026 RepID=UPI003D7E76F1
MLIQDKTVLLTGASGGIGKAIAKQLSEQGARLLLVARNQQKLEALRQSLSAPERHQSLSIDLLSSHDIKRLKSVALDYQQQGQTISVVINNAGSNQFRFLRQRSTESLQQEMQLNLMAPIILSQAALDWISRPGIILNIGSTFGSIGYPGYASYCAAKAGVHRFSEAMDRELDGTGIRMLYLAPRATDTELNSDAVCQLNQQLGNHSDLPQIVAQHVLNILQHEHRAKWIGWPEKLFARVNQIFPSLVANSIRKQQATIHQFINHNSQ